MKPGPKVCKISSPKNARPDNFATSPTPSAINEFIRQQKEILELLAQAAEVNLTKTITSLTNLIRLRLGDTLRVVVYHNWRNVEQVMVVRAARLNKQAATPLKCGGLFPAAA
jgi:hypothetical protein